IAMVPHDEPVEKATSAAKIKVSAGINCGEILTLTMTWDIKSAVCRCLVTRAMDHAKIKITIAVNMVRKPFIILSTVSFRFKIFCDRVSKIAISTPEMDDQSKAL